MKNIDVLKKDLCKQITEATPEQLKSIVDIVVEGHLNLKWIDISKALTCDKCEMMYGCKTDDSSQECIDNFKRFCEEEV